MSNFDRADWPLILLFAVVAFAPLALVVWEVASMVKRPSRGLFRFGLGHIFVGVSVVAVILGCCTWFGWTSDVIVFSIAGIAGVFWAVSLSAAVWHTLGKPNPIRRIRESDVVIAPPSTRSQKPPKRRRRPTSHKQPDYGRYGMWK